MKASVDVPVFVPGLPRTSKFFWALACHLRLPAEAFGISPRVGWPDQRLPVLSMPLGFLAHCALQKKETVSVLPSLL